MASLALASHGQCTHPIQVHRVPGAKTDSPLLAPFSMLRLLLVPPMRAERKRAQPDNWTVQRSSAAVGDQCQSDNLKVQTIGSLRLGYLHLPACPWLMGKKKWGVGGSVVMRRRCAQE